MRRTTSRTPRRRRSSPGHSRGLVGPPNPVALPSTLGQLRTLLLLGFVGGVTAAPIPQEAMRLAWRTPIHAAVLRRNLLLFLIVGKKTPPRNLRWLTLAAIEQGLRGLAKNKVITITEDTGNIIVTDFDLHSGDSLLRTVLRSNHEDKSQFLFVPRPSPDSIVHMTILPGVEPVYDKDDGLPPIVSSYDQNDLMLLRGGPSEAPAQPPQPPSYIKDNSSAPPPIIRAAMNIEQLLSAPTATQQRAQASTSEIRDLLTLPSARHTIATRVFQTQQGSAVRQICSAGTREECRRAKGDDSCTLVHFRRLIFPHTDVSIGDCSYLDTCRHVETCRYVHYEVDPLDLQNAQAAGTTKTVLSSTMPEEPAQWIRCDVRKLDFSMFRDKILVVMADPPWDIHMELPYGTMSDAEMKALPLGQVQSEGVMFLWVTGRAMELGRECMRLWGYRQVEELVWVKTNQLHRVIRTGRTGHWLNHSKEHCLVGLKGDPPLNRNLDADLIVSVVRETSRKPDEIYRIIERLCPGPYKLELFGRNHNLRPNWITLGNQLENVQLHDKTLIERYNAWATQEGEPLYEPGTAAQAQAGQAGQTDETQQPPPKRSRLS